MASSSSSSASLLTQWRRFQFFDKETPSSSTFSSSSSSSSPSPEDSQGARLLPTPLHDLPYISCASSSARHLLLGTNRGLFRLLNRDLQAWDWSGYDGEVTHVHLCERSALAFTVGEEEGVTTIKVWTLDRIEASASPSLLNAPAPSPLRRWVCFNAKFPPAYVTSLSVTEDVMQCVVGLNNGQVILWEGALLNKDKVPKQSYIVREHGSPVTALHFSEDDASPLQQQQMHHHLGFIPHAHHHSASIPPYVLSCTLFIVTADTILSCPTKTSKLVCSVIDSEGGSESGLSCLVPHAQRLVVARKDGIHLYDHEEKNSSFAFEGAKKSIAWYRTYLIMVTEAKDTSTVTSSSVIKDHITIYDLKNKLIAYQGKSDPVQLMMPALSSLYALSVLPNPTDHLTHALVHYNEKELSAKLDILFKKTLYPIALSLAESQAYTEGGDPELLFGIYCMYADHLLAQGDFDGAITQYIETIGHTEPSYVIRQFLDAQRIQQLTKYLQALHERGRANSDHTTLLLNCYTKLKDLAKLDEFVKSDTWRFDVNVAIVVCRQAGYESHALFLANKFHKHRDFINILLEHEDKSREALTYIEQLTWADADALMREFGKKLLTCEPDLTTAIIVSLSTGWHPKPRGENETGEAFPPANANERSLPDDFIHFFVDHTKQLQLYLEQMQNDNKASYLVYNTLLELYLRQDAEAKNDAHSNAVMAILKSYAGKYDIDHALVLCKLYSFEKGLLFLYAKLHFYNEILQYHIDHAQHSKILGVCKRYGVHQKQLWVQALTFFSNDTEHEHEDVITQCLEFIERENILTPVAVINILSGVPDVDTKGINNAANMMSANGKQTHVHSRPVSAIKDYLLKLMRNEWESLKKDGDEILAYESETKQLKAEIERLEKGTMVFQQTKCSACTMPLSLPVAHYLCQHSYHTKCVPEDVNSGSLAECPKCAPEFQKVRQIRASMKASGVLHDRFFKQIEDAQDGFAVVAEFFGRGIFDINTSN